MGRVSKDGQAHRVCRGYRRQLGGAPGAGAVP